MRRIAVDEDGLTGLPLGVFTHALLVVGDASESCLFDGDAGVGTARALREQVLVVGFLVEE